jgi:hypothetical protein
MEATPGFVCAQCGTLHEGLPTDRGFKLPDDVWAIPEEEREARAKWSTDLCDMDGRYFIRGVLYVPLTERNDEFGWGVWAEVERSVFIRYLEVFESDASNEPPELGFLANAIPGYDDAKNECLSIRFGRSDQRPTFFAQPDSRSSLARDQRLGLDDEGYHAMLVAAGAI